MDAWVPGAELLADMSWGLVERTVLHLATDQGEVTVKASPLQDRHTAREIAQQPAVWRCTRALLKGAGEVANR